ncbi:phage protease [Neomegalonema sp.]|uniref:phage protease n=1 Tax=Neomegalonema sp. TaxID=2039713 RepID=UPI00262326FB|nr:phage protease [Neomegalonema sp.]MDD2870093.1 phage protease [Neomegalonema sp.]
MRLQLATHATILPEGEPPEWVHLLPTGAFHGRDGRGPYSLKDAAAVAAASFGAPGDPEAVIDYDHQTDLAAVRGVGGSAPAAGWLKGFEVREDGIWARAAWTKRGAAAVASREYRYLSPVFEHSAAGEIRRVLRAALTNNPNLRLTALASREAADFTEPQSQGDEMDLLAELASALDLPQGSDQAAALAALKALKASAAAGSAALASARKAAGLAEDAPASALEKTLRTALAAATPDPSLYAPMDLVVSLQTQVESLQGERAAALIDEAVKAGKVTPANRAWALTQHAADPAAFAEFLRNQPAFPLGAAALQAQTPSADALSADELAIAARMSLTPEEFAAARRQETL